MVDLDIGRPIWEQFYCVFPLVVVGTRDDDGGDDFAPKHLAMPMSWENYFGFICSPSHRTYQNIRQREEFTVTYVRPEQSVLAPL